MFSPSHNANALVPNGLQTPRRKHAATKLGGRHDLGVAIKNGLSTNAAMCLLDPAWKFNDRPGPAERGTGPAESIGPLAQDPYPSTHRRDRRPPMEEKHGNTLPIEMLRLTSTAGADTRPDAGAFVGSVERPPCGNCCSARSIRIILG